MEELCIFGFIQTLKFWCTVIKYVTKIQVLYEFIFKIFFIKKRKLEITCYEIEYNYD